MGDAIEELLAEVTVDACNESEQLSSFCQAFEDAACFPFLAHVVGVDVEVIGVDVDGDERQGLVAVCQRSGERRTLSLLDITSAGSLQPEAQQLLAAYRRWSGVSPLPVAKPHQTHVARTVDELQKLHELSRPRSEPMTALAALTGDEQATVLAALLDAHAELPQEAERAAHQLLASASVEQIADDVASTLEAIALDDLGARCGRIRGRGYVHETEAAWELVREAVEPFLADLRRRATLGHNDAAAAVSVGIVAGLYRMREPDDGSVVAFAGPDAPGELADEVIAETTRLAVDVPADSQGRYWPQWDDFG